MHGIDSYLAWFKDTKTFFVHILLFSGVCWTNSKMYLGIRYLSL